MYLARFAVHRHDVLRVQVQPPFLSHAQNTQAPHQPAAGVPARWRTYRIVTERLHVTQRRCVVVIERIPRHCRTHQSRIVSAHPNDGRTSDGKPYQVPGSIRMGTAAPSTYHHPRHMPHGPTRHPCDERTNRHPPPSPPRTGCRLCSDPGGTSQRTYRSATQRNATSQSRWAASLAAHSVLLNLRQRIAVQRLHLLRRKPHRNDAVRNVYVPTHPTARAGRQRTPRTNGARARTCEIQVEPIAHPAALLERNRATQRVHERRWWRL